MSLRLRFICESCRNMNKHRRENQPIVETDYTVFSLAVAHIIEMKHQYGDTHFMDVIIEEDNATD